MPGLLLLLLFIVQCGGCDFDLKGVGNIKATIDSNPTGFRSVFPKDYRVVHHYTRSMLCETEPCCVFSAAVVLVKSWHVLLTNLWDQHFNYTFIFELKQTLDIIVKRNKNIERFQEETDLDQYPTLSSSPEELLNLTSELFARWLQPGPKRQRGQLNSRKQGGRERKGGEREARQSRRRERRGWAFRPRGRFTDRK
ncbi:hypothetical protein ATANTOWER_029856 [Ataeniobius toweri]|uniref:Uncharacterized protein n=1 Tax=Ataeniobius toweri TaxID=208326 RepID=A0ABU7BF50_9TELE|nr:hypothetical protein [Ataeniobius toweri]